MVNCGDYRLLVVDVGVIAQPLHASCNEDCKKTPIFRFSLNLCDFSLNPLPHYTVRCATPQSENDKNDKTVKTQLISLSSTSRPVLLESAIASSTRCTTSACSSCTPSSSVPVR